MDVEAMRLMNFEEACRQVVRFLKDVVPLGCWAVTRRVEDRQVFVHVLDDVYGITTGHSAPWPESLCHAMVTGDAPHIAPDAMAVREYAAAGVVRDVQIGAYVGMPIRDGDGALYGTICGLDPAAQDSDLHRHAPILGLLADLLSRVLEVGSMRAGAEKAATELSWQAKHDRLTGLPNRTLFMDRLDHALTLHLRDRRPLAVLLFDLDGFKAVNDQLGHSAGDDLLARIGQRVRGCLRPGDTLARLYGDDFAVLLEDSSDPRAVGQRVLDSLREPFEVPRLDGGITIAASMGIAGLTAGGEAVSASGLLSRADIAMYSAKHSGKGRFVMFDDSMTLPAAGDLALLEPFRRAVLGGRIDVAYQPVVDLVSGETIAFEALARWSRDGHDVPPDVFIPMAARNGLLWSLTGHVLEAACAQLSAWSRDRGDQDLRIGVNIPAAMMEDLTFPDVVADLIARHGLASGQLVLEITEDSLLAGAPGVRAVADRLSGIGALLSLDDFGTGYSSLLHLRQIPLHYLKIDRGFISDLGKNPVTERFVRALLALGRDLGLEVVVEGVERQEQVAVLRRLGCRFVQGFLFGRPAAVPTGVPCAAPAAVV